MARTNPDEYILNAVADWQIARLRCLLTWAEGDKANLFGCRDDGRSETPVEALKMLACKQKAMADMRPQTTDGARALLLVASLILQHRTLDPEAEDTLSQGPLLEIIRNVHEALGYAPDVVIRPERQAA